MKPPSPDFSNSLAALALTSSAILASTAILHAAAYSPSWLSFAFMTTAWTLAAVTATLPLLFPSPPGGGRR